MWRTRLSRSAKTAELIKKNYGFAGRKFVDVLKKNIGMEEVERIQQKIQRGKYMMMKKCKNKVYLYLLSWRQIGLLQIMDFSRWSIYRHKSSIANFGRSQRFIR